MARNSFRGTMSILVALLLAGLSVAASLQQDLTGSHERLAEFDTTPARRRALLNSPHVIRKRQFGLKGEKATRAVRFAVITQDVHKLARVLAISDDIQALAEGLKADDIIQNVFEEEGLEEVDPVASPDATAVRGIAQAVVNDEDLVGKLAEVVLFSIFPEVGVFPYGLTSSDILDSLAKSFSDTDLMKSIASGRIFETENMKDLDVGSGVDCLYCKTCSPLSLCEETVWWCGEGSIKADTVVRSGSNVTLAMRAAIEARDAEAFAQILVDSEDLDALAAGLEVPDDRRKEKLEITVDRNDPDVVVIKGVALAALSPQEGIARKLAVVLGKSLNLEELNPPLSNKYTVQNLEEVLSDLALMTEIVEADPSLPDPDPLTPADPPPSPPLIAPPISEPITFPTTPIAIPIVPPVIVTTPVIVTIPTTPPEVPVGEPDVPVGEPDGPVDGRDVPVGEPDGPVDGRDVPVGEPDGPVDGRDVPVGEPDVPRPEIPGDTVPQFPPGLPPQFPSQVSQGVDVPNFGNFEDLLSGPSVGSTTRNRRRQLLVDGGQDVNSLFCAYCWKTEACSEMVWWCEED